tara:strand:+ start:297 stop:509 length:213 start_codon:yes stop_codon:yes gene_type:complete
VQAFARFKQEVDDLNNKIGFQAILPTLKGPMPTRLENPLGRLDAAVCAYIGSCLYLHSQPAYKLILSYEL